MIDVRFDSFAALLADYASASPRNEKNAVRLLRYRNVASNVTWFDIPRVMTAPQLAQFLTTGWSEGVQRMRETIERIQAPRVHSVRRRSRWTDQGDTVDMTRMYAGHFDTAFRACKRVAVQQPPRVHITVNMAATGDTPASLMFFRGAAAAALCEALCSAGYSVAVDAAASVTLSDARETPFTLRARVKHYDAPLTLSALVAATAHPASFRAVVHAEMAINGPLKLSAGMSHVAKMEPLSERGARSFVVPHSILSPERANEWLRDTIADLEGEAAA